MENNLNAITLAYGAHFRDYPFLRLLELEKINRKLTALFETLVIDDLIQLQIHVSENTSDYLKVTMAMVIKDIQNEIADIKRFIKR